MADQVQPVGVLARDDGQLGIAVYRVAGIDQGGIAAFVGDPAGQRGLGQPGADGRGDIRHRDGGRELTLGTIGQRYLDH